MKPITILKTWIVLSIFVSVSELGRVIHFIETHYGYGKNGVHTRFQEFIYQLSYNNLWNESIYGILIFIGIFVIILNIFDHVKSE